MPISLRFRVNIFSCLAGFWLLGVICVSAQVGPGPFNNVDLVQIYVDGQGHRNKDAERQRIDSNRALVDSGAASILDLTAPPDALGQFDRALALMKQQKSKESWQVSAQGNCGLSPIRFRSRESRHCLLGSEWPDTFQG